MVVTNVPGGDMAMGQAWQFIVFGLLWLYLTVNTWWCVPSNPLGVES